MIGVTLSYPLLILASNASPDMKPTLVGYLGVLLMGLSFLGVGLLISPVTANQIIAAVGAFGASLAFWILPWDAQAATVTLARQVNPVTVGLREKLRMGVGRPPPRDVLDKLWSMD